MRQYCDGLGINLILIAYPSIRQLSQESLIHIMKRYYHQYHDVAVVYGMMGILSNLTASLVTYPLQTLRTRIQAKVFLPTSITSPLSSSSTSSPSSLSSCVYYYKGFYYKMLSVILHGFIFYYMQKVLHDLIM